MSDSSAAAPITPPSSAPAGAPPAAPPGGAPTGSMGTGAPPIQQGADLWTKGFNEDLRGYVQNKGFKDPESVLDSYRNLEKLLGAPKERLLKIPERSDDKTGWEEVYSKLGRPPKADDYKILPEKGQDDTFAKYMQQTLFEAGISKQQGEALATKYAEFATKLAETQKEAQGQKNMQEETSLKKEWGATFDQNTKMARNAAMAFGFDEATIDKLEQSLGFAGVMKMMHKIGTKLGEDSFVVGNRIGGAMTPDQARNKINALKGDPDWTRRYLGGGTVEREEMNRLHEYLVAGQ